MNNSNIELLGTLLYNFQIKCKTYWLLKNNFDPATLFSMLDTVLINTLHESNINTSAYPNNNIANTLQGPVLNINEWIHYSRILLHTLDPDNIEPPDEPRHLTEPQPLRRPYRVQRTPRPAATFNWHERITEPITVNEADEAEDEADEAVDDYLDLPIDEITLDPRVNF